MNHQNHITTRRLILRPWAESDAEALYAIAKDPLVGPATGWPVHTSAENSREVIKSILAVPETYAVCLKENGMLIGDISLMLGDSGNIKCPGEEGELGCWLGSAYWGRGLIPEAIRALVRHAFFDLNLQTLWCGYFDGNEKSRRCMEKCGFVYDHTNPEAYRPPLGITVTEHVARLTREEWENQMTIVKLSGRRDLKDRAAAWFAGKWRVPEAAYLESIEESFNAVVPSWYLCLEGENIIAGAGVIENDFHERKDLTPNVCAVYTEPEYRNRGIAGRLLNHICGDMASKGIKTLYLLTDHTGFYERYGWEFCDMVLGDGEDKPSRMYIHRTEEIL